MENFFDGNKMVSIDMIDNRSGCSFENDFFEVGQLHYEEERNAFRVDDVDYLIDYATSYADGTNSDFEYPVDEDGNIILPDIDVTVEEF